MGTNPYRSIGGPNSGFVYHRFCMKRFGTYWKSILVLAALFLGPGSARAADTKVYELKDGTSHVGVVVEELESGILLKTRTGEVVRIKFDDIAGVSPLAEQVVERVPKERPFLDKHDLQTNQAVTLDLIELVRPALVEFASEFAVHKRHGLVTSLGLGQYDGVTATGVGFQYRAYFMGDFDTGLNVGIEESYVAVPYGLYAGTVLSSNFFCGGKYTLTNGLVIDGRLGYASVNNLLDSPTTRVTLALNVGYAFGR